VVLQAPATPPIAPFSLHRMLKPWDETRADWLNSGFGDWAQPGALAGTDFVAPPSATNQIPGSGAYLFSDLTLLNDVRMWMTNSAANNGWMLLCDAEDLLQSARRFGTREHADPSARPELILDYTVPFSIQLTHPRTEDGQFVFDFVATPGTDYVVEYKDDLSSEWLLFDYYPDPGVETVHTVFDDGGAGQRFFRVLSATTP
jgi:hypothetical protein